MRVFLDFFMGVIFPVGREMEDVVQGVQTWWYIKILDKIKGTIQLHIFLNLEMLYLLYLQGSNVKYFYMILWYSEKYIWTLLPTPFLSGTDSIGIFWVMSVFVC